MQNDPIISTSHGNIFHRVSCSLASQASSTYLPTLKTLLSSTAGPKPVVVRASRVGNGRVIELTANREEYDALGVIPADNLNPQKARILLMLAFTKTRDVSEIQRMFSQY